MIDVIIPAYNAHETIIKTLCSIALQTIKDKIRVYIVNDGSDNNYHKEVEMFKAKIEIKELMMPKNSGPGLARQYGIDNSDGKYIIFLDADDLFFDCYAVNNLYKNIISDNYDLAIGIMIDETDNGYFEYQGHLGCLHGKMYKRSFLDKFKIKFNEIRSSEDDSFNKLVMLAKPHTIFVSDYIYLYRNNSNSITQKDKDNYLFTSLENYINNMVWVVKQAEIRNFDKIEIAKHIVFSCYYIYLVYNDNIQRKDANKIFCWIIELYKYYLKYNSLLSEGEKYEIYFEYDYKRIPKLSFEKFLEKVEENKMEDD